MAKPLRRDRVLATLNRLAADGCGCPPWCRCLICRVRRIVKTEQYRTQAPFRGEWCVEGKSPAKGTKLIDWRGGRIEFARNGHEHLSNPPWYVIRMSGKCWGRDWYDWLDYLGPPKVYLSRATAVQKAKELRKQFGRRCKVTVVKITP